MIVIADETDVLEHHHEDVTHEDASCWKNDAFLADLFALQSHVRAATQEWVNQELAYLETLYPEIADAYWKRYETI